MAVGQGDPREPVDPPDQPRTVYGTVTGWAVAEQRPIVPAWMRNRDERRQVARLAANRVARAAGYHATRAPLYALRYTVHSPRGAVRIAARAHGAVFDAEGRPLRQHAVARNDADTYLKLAALRRKHIRGRVPVVVLVALGLTAIATLAALGPVWLTVLVIAAAVLACGHVGAPADRPIVQGATVTTGQAPKLTSDSVTAALRSLGIAALNARGATVDFPHPIRVDGPGWRADVDLPLGVTALDVMERRSALASGLRRPIGCVWPEPDPDTHAGRLVLWVGMQDMAKARPAPWPLRKTGTADIFGTLPFLTDQRGRPVGLPLIESNMLIGSLPGAGKTAALRCVLLGCALDPTVEMHIWELKGSGDLESLQRIAHAYGSGVDDETIGACLDGLRWLLAEVARRADRLKTLRQRSRDLVPDSKVTRDLANRRGLGLHPIVFTVDEAQELFSHPEYGKEAGELATAIIKRGRALGVILILATQRPDKDSLPTGVSANVGTRFCLRVMGQVENDMVLGTSSYKNGIRATTFTRSDRGIGYLVGATDAPVVGRTYYLDAAAADAVVARAYRARETAGLLTGQAAGEVVDHGHVVDVLTDVRTVFATIEVLHTADLLERLAELRPQLYGGWTERQLAAALKPHGFGPKQLSIDGVNRNGYRLDWVREALARRELGSAG
ncbi:cell division protein FtsK/SpoIIIE [Pseudonocardia dioxanivorans CB1190]|uniref:Cell division protein FtsK/SpoIIIE n=1 Tax=Pseudonocardia dioxanivorans (strain ATCC 55486 / DSM 44775 / JCM 13855 / CB1190) TaxID=675635 RepID=F4D1B7_PSEUX|nr:FtsK/SpoIIIE domain-containing protein [Pseudonocardia dioxanivorans]AEA27905.1 cell division protein FtsK/SpoIIIE [Pseudonocardia dioxanivorans CB1190]